MTAPQNLSFETVGATPGSALGWTVTITFTGAPIGDFSGGAGAAPTPIEQFDVVPFAFVVTGSTPSIFDVGQSPAPGPIERFAYWSGNVFYTPTIPNGIVGSFAGGVDLESFEEPAHSYVTVVSGGVTFLESFEEPAPTYATTVSGGTVGLYYQATRTIEDFEIVQPDVVFAVPVPANNNLVTTTPHGLPNGRKVTVRSTGSPPGALTTGADYYVINTASTTLQLSLTVGGAAIALTSSGIGTHSLHGDETLFWTDGP